MRRAVIYHDARVGFDALAPAFLADLALANGAATSCRGPRGAHGHMPRGLDFGNPLRTALGGRGGGAVRRDRGARGTGTAMIGLPAWAARRRAGYRDFSYRRKLARERTKRGSLA